MAFWDLTPPPLCVFPTAKPFLLLSVPQFPHPGVPLGLGMSYGGTWGWWWQGEGQPGLGTGAALFPPPPQLQHTTPLPPLLSPPVRLTLVALHWPFRPFYFLGVSHAAWGLNGEGGGDGGQHLLTTPQLGMCVWGGVRPCTVLSWCRSAPGAERWTRGGSDPPRPLGVGRIS